jgi:hypothetical protein
MPQEPLFRPPGGHGSALEQLLNLRNMASRQAPAAEPVVEAIDAAPVEAFAAGAQAEAPAAAAQVATELGPEAVVAEGAEQAFANAANQVVDVHVQPRVVMPTPAEPLVVPVDVAVPAAQPRVTVAAPEVVYVDRATGQVVAAPVAEAVETSPRAGFRSWSAEDIGNLFGGRRAPAAAAEVPVVAATPVAGEAVQVAEETAKPSLVDQLRGAFTGARGTGHVAAEVPVAGAAAEVVADTAPVAAKPSLIDQLRAAGGALRGPAANGAGEVVAGEVVADTAAKAPKGIAAIREGLAGLGALRAAPVREAVEETVEHAPGLAERALQALSFASKVK